MLTTERGTRGLDVSAYRIERRGSRRELGWGTGMAAFHDARGDVSLSPVSVVDRSGAGLGVVSPVAAAPGTRVTLYGDQLPLPHLSATVVRCHREGDQYRIGLRCDARMAA